MNERSPKVPEGPVTRESLLTLEAYAKARPAFRARVIAHKRPRTVQLGDHVTLAFEDALTMRYQIQEMLYWEKTFDEAGIQNELDAYTPLVPDGTNLKATMLIEYEDVDERRAALARLRGIEDRVWMKVGNFRRVDAIADEDLERETDTKTSAVHFLRFELERDMIAALKAGADLSLGIDHDAYQATLQASADTRASLAGDLA